MPLSDMSMTTSKPVLAINRGAASGLSGIAADSLKDCGPPDRGSYQ